MLRFDTPDATATDRLERVDVRRHFLSVRDRAPQNTSGQPPLPWLYILLLLSADVHAPLDADVVEQARLQIERRLVPAAPAHPWRTEDHPLVRGRLEPILRHPFRIETARPVDEVHVLERGD